MKTITAPIDALNLGVAKATLKALEFLPKMPAARLYTDLVFQFGHSHPHPPTFGFPIPSLGPVVASGCMSVLINGLPAARNGDMGFAVWCGGYFPIFEIFMGSSHVFIGGSRAARQLMDPTYHCLPSPFGGKWGIGKLDIAMAGFGMGMSALNVAASVEKSVEATYEASEKQGEADAQMAAAAAAAAGVGAATAAAQFAADAAAMAMGLLMGKDPGVGFPFGIITMGSPNVLVGGFPMPGWMTIMKGLFKMLKPVIRRIQLKLPPGRTRNALCRVTGHPVEVATGRMYTTSTDFEIRGRIPIVFERVYDTSGIDYESSLGWGWTHPYDQHLWQSKRYNCLVWRNQENHQVRFEKLNIGDRQFQPLERVWLERKSEAEYELFDCKDGLYYSFGQTDSEDFRSEKEALRLLKVFDRNENFLDLKYEDRSLVEIDGNTAGFVTLHYQRVAGRKRLGEVRHHLTNGQDISLMRFGYNGDAELTSATNRSYVPYTYSYENHLMTKETNRNGLSFHFEYEGAGTEARCVHTWGDDGIYERWLTYLPKNNMTREKDGLGGETIYHYNDLELVTKVFDAEGGISEFDYGLNGELLQEKDEIGRIRTYAYDDQLNCTAATQEDGTVRTVKYNDFCQPIAVSDESGAVWTREYDNSGNIVATINPLDARREYDYDKSGDIKIFRDALGNETQFAWTTAGQIKSVEKPGGGKVSYNYNERGFLEEVVDEVTDIKTSYRYDDVGRVKRIADINPKRETINVQRYEYDSQDNMTLLIDAYGNKTLYKYSGYDKLARRVDSLGHERQFEYDEEGRLEKIVNENNENYRFEYDLLDRVVKEIGFDGAITSYKYNQAGELVYKKDALKRETYYRRDAMGRVVRRLMPKAETVDYEYDECGRITGARNSNSEIKLTYDDAWQVIRENQNGKTVSFEYDLEGRRTARNLDSDLHEKAKVEYSYDKDSNLSTIKLAENEINYLRDQVGRLTAKDSANGLQEQFEYDINGRLSVEKVTVGAGGREVVKRDYEWDSLGNVVGIHDSLRGGKRYQYDAVERLKTVERLVAGTPDTKTPDVPKDKPRGWIPPEKRLWQAESNLSRWDNAKVKEIEEFQYDADGNLIERKSNVSGSRKFKYSKGDKLKKQGKTTYIYDAVGNLVEKRAAEGPTSLFTYDSADQVIAITKDNQKVEFEYDAFGRRTLKKTKDNETQFLWDGDVLLLENDTHYIHDGFVPVAKVSNSEVETYHTDYLGTPKEVTNESGEIIWQGNYDEYGKVNPVIEKTEQNIRFQGQYEDEETGLFYNRFRYYSADDCRYVNQDPIGLFGNFNLYEYCTNPVMWFDPLGLDEIVYQLLDSKGNVIYYGITERTALTRGNEHIDSGKRFAKMQVIASGLTHDQARSLEAALIRQRLAQKRGSYSPFDSVEDQLKKSGLLNKNRGRTPDRWVDKPLKKVKRLDTPEDVEGLKKRQKTKAC
ncbi:MAG: hypothetical protein HKN25_18130 [Pyrinomonadaceae bacterium]|nr:hypothetical protein [Pyrinomonadaceae bacterium]